MADLTPLISQMSVDLSLRLNDPSTGGDNGIKAAADGDTGIWTAVQRNHYLHHGMRWLGTTLMFKMGAEGVYKFCPGLISTFQFTFASNGTTLPQDYMETLWLYKAGGLPFTRSVKMLLDLDQDRIVSRAYAIEGMRDEMGLVYGYERTAGVLSALNSGTGILFYVKADRKDLQGVDVPPNTLPDTTIDQKWHNTITTYACGLALHDKGQREKDQEMVGNGISFMKLAESTLPNVSG